MSTFILNPLCHIVTPSITTKFNLNDPNNKLLFSKSNKSSSNLHLRKSSNNSSLAVKCIKEEGKVGSVNEHHQKHNLVVENIPPPTQLPFYDLERDDFPHDFLFGASTSALQIEGQGNEGGRGKGTWDSMIEANKGRKAVDSYNLYKEDVKLLKEMGMNTYRFSISWSRILPNGTIRSGVNEDGINFYNYLINELIENDITPMVTLLHFDLPQIIQDEFGGFLSPHIRELFKEYADLCFKKFGDRVKCWGTINEPLIYVYLGKKMGFPPQLQIDTEAPYIAYHNIILAHSEAAKLYKHKYQKKQGGKIGISLPIQWSMPFNQHDSMDLAATEACLDLSVGWFMNPLVHGDYPEWMKNNVPGLPKFTNEEKELVKDAYDFIGINYYSSRYIQQSFSYDGMTGEVTISFKTQTENVEKKNLGKPAEGRKDIYDHPNGLKQLLLHMKKKYGNPEVYVTENGISSQPTISGSIKDLIKHGKYNELQDAFYDYDRIKYAAGHLIAVRDAIREGANVKGYVVWSLLDNMEVGSGYDVRFGLNFVDYFDNHKRYPKLSAIWLTKFLKSHIVGY
ncbi:beta-glucosidase 13-like [Chenopodium quinoa]|uniref:beta-glucosidase 13-like n=1 Tax=Chenopodium quinoa TaxID=63459 RepID=UPI000B791A0A|nr:beta-glucosidase 13-like [Chenopodium quinoa]